MSSFLRTIQKNALKRAGYRRSAAGIVDPVGDLVVKNGKTTKARWPKPTTSTEAQ